MLHNFSWCQNSDSCLKYQRGFDWIVIHSITDEETEQHASIITMSVATCIRDQTAEHNNSWDLKLLIICSPEDAGSSCLYLSTPRTGSQRSWSVGPVFGRSLGGSLMMYLYELSDY